MLPPNDKRTTSSCKKRKPDLLDIADKPGSSSEHKSFMTAEFLGTEEQENCTSMGSLESLPAGVQSFEEMSGHRSLSYFMSPEESPSSQLNADDNDILTQSQDTETFSDGVTPPDRLLTQFEAYFKDRLKNELNSFQGNMTQLLGEQLMHVRRILSPSSPELVSQSDIETDGVTMSDMETLPQSAPDHVAPGNPGLPPCQCQCAPSNLAPTSLPPPPSSPPPTSPTLPLLVELLSLCCELSAILSMEKYAT